jgi:4-oxalocrotonate tautomerase
MLDRHAVQYNHGTVTPRGRESAAEGDAMPNITIQWFAGRTQDLKRQLTAAITEAMVKIGKTTPDAVHIVFQDVEKSDWGHNGKLSSD